MSEFELAYMVNETFDTAYVVFQFWTYITFGVLAAAYFVDGKLPRTMLHLASILYVILATNCFVEVFLFIDDAEALGTRLTKVRSEAGLSSSGWASDGFSILFSQVDIALTVVAMVLGTVGAVYHLYFTARKGAPKPT